MIGPQFHTHPASVLRFEEFDLTFDTSTNVLTSSGRKVKIEPRLGTMLLELSKQPFTAVTRHDLLQSYPASLDTNLDEALTLTISRLRKILNEEFGITGLVQTVPNKGYRLLSEVEHQRVKRKPILSRPMSWAAGVITFVLVFILLLVRNESRHPGLGKSISSIETSYPSWSPDGKTLAVQSNRMDNNSEIYLISQEGELLKRLTHNTAADEYPSISPDGTRIVFASKVDGNQEIYLMDISGKNKVNLTRDPSSDFMPRWSPDGTSILFCSDRAGDMDVYNMDLRTMQVQRIVPDLGDEKYASWSPDAKYVLFVRLGAATPKTASVLIYNIETGNEKTLTSGKYYDSWPSWSPDGKEILFASNRYSKSNYSLFKLDKATGQVSPVLLAENEAMSYTKPFYAFDGTNRIVCTRTMFSNVEIFILSTHDSAISLSPLEEIASQPFLMAER